MNLAPEALTTKKKKHWWNEIENESLWIIKKLSNYNNDWTPDNILSKTQL